jgi:diguanylate cyclase (GGDEF)-like protein/PAS domain S-box-containing protein
VNTQANKQRFLGLKWKAFIGLSLLLLALGGALYALNYRNLVAQFHAQRQLEMKSLSRQIDAMLVKNGDRLIRLSGALASLSDIGRALREHERQRFSEDVDFARYANLGYELDVQWIEIFTPDAKPVWRWSQSAVGEPPRELFLAAVEHVRRAERPATLLACKPLCLLYAFVPILAEGENVGIMVLGQSLADFVLDLQLIPSTDIALVMPDTSAAGGVLPQWKASIAAATHPAKIIPLLRTLAERFRNPAELDQNQFFPWQDEDFDVHRFPLRQTLPNPTGFIVFISDVGAQLDTIRATIRQGLMAHLAALLAGELGFLYLLNLPIRRLKRVAAHLPLLAEGAYRRAREQFHGLRGKTWFYDEIDHLSENAVTLAHRLEQNALTIAARNKELASERDFIQSLLDSAQVMVLTLTHDGIIQEANQFAAQLTGYESRQLRGRRFTELVSNADEHPQIIRGLNALCGNKQQRLEHEYILLRRNGEQRQVVWVHTPLKAVHPNGTAVLSVGLDITERVKAESEIHWLANHDPLTGLVNRHCFANEFTRVLHEIERCGSTAALLLFDLDHFKEINDSSGHPAGDKLLCLIAEQLKSRTRKTDVVSRLGGDEFAVLMPQTDAYGAENFALKFIEHLNGTPFVYEEKRYRVGCSIGIALIPEHGKEIHELMTNADIALYEAKHAGRSCHYIFSAAQGNMLTETVYWKDILTQALIDKSLIFHYQPVIDVASGDIRFHEALLRLRMQDGRLAMPAEFLPSAERSSLIYDIDLYVVDAALEALFAAPEKKLSLNLSAAALNDERWTDKLLRAVAEKSLNPDRLIFEITETAVIADMEKAREITERVAKLGFRFAVDDFGVGFGSLYYLRQLPISYIKIDRSLLKSLAIAKDDRKFVQALAMMVCAYGKEVIYEGVEDAATLALIKAMGVGLAQGYYFGRPNADATGM